jgi:hypothetical protein
MADLTQFGVPTEQGQAMVMPKLQYRFRVNLVNFGGVAGANDVTQNVVSVTRPSLTHDEVTLDAYNSKVYLAGKHSWETLTLTLRDDMNNRVNQAVAKQLQRQLNHGTQAAPPAGQDYKFGMTIEQLDGGNSPRVIESWTINGCFIQNVNYGENNYATSDVMQITLAIRYDNADLHGGTAFVTDTGALSSGVMITGGIGGATGGTTVFGTTTGE